ncbi:MAG: ubiquinol-cytochrome c reductase iron-sulfur subunit [Gemmatimonadales bacterium]
MCACPDQPACANPARRDFLGRLALAAVGTLLADACVAGLGTGPSSFSGSFSVTVTDYPALASVGGIALLSGAPVPMAAVRTGATSFDVFSRRCPHQGTTINLSGSGFRCPNHGAQFNAQGQNVGGQPTGSLTRFNSTYDTGTDTLTVTA